MILAFVTALGLASCDAGPVSQTLVGETAKPSVPPVAPKPGGSANVAAVVTTKALSDAYRDLERCRAVVAASMGPPGVADDLEALKRALKAHPNDHTISLAYVNDDRAIRRKQMIKDCLFESEYIVKR